MKVLIPMKAPSASNQRHAHWGARAAQAKRQRNAAALLVKPKLQHLGPTCLVVLLTRIAPRELDDDNLRGALKAVRDGVATALRVDDRCPLVRWDYAQRKGSEPHEHAVEVLISWELAE